jgi:hypothetical protein
MAGRRIGALLAIACLVALAGCASPRLESISNAEVVGTWSSDTGTTVQLDESGTFTASNVPGSVIDYSSRVSFVSVKGTWDTAADEYLGVPYLQLDVVESDPVGAVGRPPVPLLARLVDGHLTLFFVLGDPDARDWRDLQRVPD